MRETKAFHPIVKKSYTVCRVQTQRVIERGYLGAWWSLVGVFALQLDLHKFLCK